ncbi:MAG: geranylgeranyl reductase family protein [Ktedonobacterales bacterium]
MQHDVIVVGGGPAGSTTAYELSRQGFNVCLLEKYTMPRYKTCGGGVNIRAANLIPFTLEPVVERVIHRYRFTYRGEKPFERTYPKPLTYMTQRMRLDQYLLEQARSVGTNVREGITVRKVAVTEDQAIVVTDAGEQFEGKVLVGADGANSVVARDLDLMRSMRREIALESEISLSPEEMARWSNTIEIDLFSTWCGYGWVFPKEEHISIGVGGIRQQIKQIQDYNEQYLEQHQVARAPKLRFSGHTLPIREGYAPLVKGRGLLVGDAAGLLEPFTGEGIGYAIRSGQIAGRTVGSFLNGEFDSLDVYTSRLDSEIMPDLADAQRFVKIFNRFPSLFFRLIRDNDYVWEAICLILRGERSFQDINRKLGVFRYLLPILEGTS